MVVGRVCSECGTPLAGKSVRAITCGVNCRQARTRRVQRTNRQEAEFADIQGAGAAEIAAIVRRESTDVVTKVFKDQLAPIVREAINEDVLRAVRSMVKLTPRAVELLALDLEDEDSTVRQRAYTLITKYTVGHPALIKPEDEGAGPLTVNFNLPRPDDSELVGPEILDADEDMRACDMCNSDKPASEFAAGSSRCQECFDAWRVKVLERFS